MDAVCHASTCPSCGLTLDIELAVHDGTATVAQSEQGYTSDGDPAGYVVFDITCPDCRRRWDVAEDYP